MGEVADDGKAIVERLKAERAEKLKQAKNGLPTRVVRTESKIIVPNFGGKSTGVLRTGVLRERATKVVAAKPVEIVTPPEVIPTDDRHTALERTIAALARVDIPFSYDLFRHKFHVGDRALQQRIGENPEHVILVLRTMMNNKFKFDPGPEKMRAAVYRLCLNHAFNPVRDYLDRLKWDGVPRLDTWLSTYLGAADGKLNRAIGRKVLIAGVRRVREPGTKFDQIMVWEGAQGSGKSSAIRILAGDFFSDAEIIGLGGREVMELCTGVWFYEISELEGLGKRDVAHVKAFVTRMHDRARPAFGHALEERGRTCIFIGTTNGSDYLIDETGNRRFWPVVTGKIDLVGLARDRDQLFAEAAAVEATGEGLVIDEPVWGEAAERTDARLPSDPWQDILARLVNMPTAYGSIERIDGEIRVTSQFLLDGVLHLDPAKQKVTDGKRVSAIMKRLGWAKPDNIRMGNWVGKGYVKKIE